MIKPLSRRRSRGPLPRLPALALAVVLAATACGDGPAQPAPPPGDGLLAAALAAGLAPLPEQPLYPTENPYLAERVELGQLLFFDPLLSGAGDVACSTCHLPRFAFADGRQFPSGAGGTGLGPERTDPAHPLRLMPRNSPTILNVGMHGNMSPEPSLRGTMFWGGSAFGLEDQVFNPIAADTELRGTSFSRAEASDSIVARLRGNSEYVDGFAAAFPERVAVHGRDTTRLVTPTTVERALAAYIRELNTPDAPIDRFLRGDENALNSQQKAGLALFIGKARCTDCHRGPQLSDFNMHVLGTPQAGIGRDTTPGDDIGWGEVGGTPYAFRTPPLRQVALTAPYFHAGTAATLRDVVEFKNAGASGYSRVAPAQLDNRVQALGLTAAEIGDLVTLLGALTDNSSLNRPLFQAPPAVPSGLDIPK